MTPFWDNLLDEASLASLLPNEYARFAWPIRDGLTRFLNGLSPSRQAAILRAQAGLPASATFSQRLGALAQCSPTLQKLGQVLARDRRLAAELRQHLRQLESLPPTVPLAVIEQTLSQELGPLDQLGVTLLPPAIAEASVAVVIPFQQQSGGSNPEISGVFKVLKPGIEQQLEDELSLLERVGEFLDDRCDDVGIPHLDYQDAFQQVRWKLGDEVQLGNEQRHLVQARTFFSDQPRVRIPRLLEHCTPRVTAMERVSGGKVTAHRLDGRDKRRLAQLIAIALITKPVFSTADVALFHGDPHAGNLFLTDDGCLAILDWSLVGSLDVRQRVAMVQIALAAITLDQQRLVTVLADLADSRLDRQTLQSVVAKWIKRVRRGQFPGLGWLVGLLDEAVQNARLRVGADLMLFRKSLHTLEGVVNDVGENSGQIDKTLSIEFLRHFAVEWPRRWLSLPHARDFATRLSNLDVTQTLFNLPMTLARFWTGHARDALEACRQSVGIQPRAADVGPSNNSPPATNPE